MNSKLQEQWRQMLSQSFDPRQWFVEGERPEAEVILEGTLMWVYRRTENGQFEVGYYSPDREWHQDSQYRSREEAVRQVNHLNGGGALVGAEVAQAAERGYRGQ